MIVLIIIVSTTLRHAYYGRHNCPVVFFFLFFSFSFLISNNINYVNITNNDYIVMINKYYIKNSVDKVDLKLN